MSDLKGLKLGGADKDLTTPPSGPAPATDDSKELKPVEEVRQEVVRNDEPAARWSSHPIARYAVGDYHFANGLLVLQTEQEAEDFQKVYDSLPVYEQCRMTKIDLSAAEALVRERLAVGGGATKVMDSSVGDRAPNGAIGTGDLLD